MAKLWRITLDTNPEDCNLHCIMCEEHSPYSDFIPELYRTTGVKRRRMSFEIVARIIQEAADLGVKEIIPSTMGEPLLYKGIEKLFTLTADLGMKVNLTTNGTFPCKTVENWAALIVPATSDVKISWNGATAEVAKEVMRGIDFEKTIENVRRFIAYRNEYFAKYNVYCRVTFQLTFMQNNMHELADMIRLAAELDIDRVKGHHLWAHFDEIKSLSMKADGESVRNWNRYVNEAVAAQEKYRKPDGKKITLENISPMEIKDKADAVPDEYVCPFLNQELWISATGKISPCCAPDALRQSLGDFGNIENTTLLEVLNSEAYQALTKSYKNSPLCQNCNMRKPLND